MRNYTLEVQNISNELNLELIQIYDVVVNKFGERPVQIGKNPPQRNCFEIKVNLKTRIENYFTKINGIGYDKTHRGREFFVKGFQVARLRYRMKPIKDLTIKERQEILEHIKEYYNI